MKQIEMGSIVVHDRCPAWGPGKVFSCDHNHIVIGFMDTNGQRQVKKLARSGFVSSAPEGLYPQFDDWNPKFDAAGHVIEPRRPGGGPSRGKVRVAPPAQWTLPDAFQHFLLFYPLGFRDPKYGESERDWKWKHHLMWREHLGADRLRNLAATDPEEAANWVMRVIQTTVVPLLSVRGELPVLHDALHTPAATAYFCALADFVDQPPSRDTFDAMVAALGSLPVRNASSRILTWPTVTVVPFLARPDGHMFIKPARTKKAARLLGTELLYDSHPKWDTYERVMAWSEELLAFLRPHGAVDMIDVQSFVWTIAR